jgi:tRNA threonylcarbamoyladenosine biosynthesis protein TsaB
VTAGLAPGGPILVVDTATTHAVIALGRLDGALTAERSWVAGYRHGEELLARIDAMLRDEGVVPAALGGLVVGIGPGAFTGLRVGIATVKGLAYALGLPIVGVATGEALLAAAGTAGSGADGRTVDLALLQPAGPADAVLSRPGERPRIVPGGTDPGLRPGERLVAVDLDGRADEGASTLGAAALRGLAAALLQAGAARLAAADPDDLVTLVPEYVTLPRGVREAVPEALVEVTGGGEGGGRREPEMIRGSGT